MGSDNDSDCGESVAGWENSGRGKKVQGKGALALECSDLWERAGWRHEGSSGLG